MDINAEYHKRASNLGMEKQRTYLQYEISKPDVIRKDLETAKKRLEKAKERNFKTLDEWEEKIEAYTKVLEDSKVSSLFYNDISNAISDGTAQCRICTFVWQGKWKYTENISLGVCVVIKHMGYTYIFGTSPDSQSMFCSMGKRRRTRAGRRKLPYSQVRKKPGNPDFSAALCVYFNAACGIRTRG